MLRSMLARRAPVLAVAVLSLSMAAGSALEAQQVRVSGRDTLTLLRRDSVFVRRLPTPNDRTAVAGTTFTS